MSDGIKEVWKDPGTKNHLDYCYKCDKPKTLYFRSADSKLHISVCANCRIFSYIDGDIQLSIPLSSFIDNLMGVIPIMGRPIICGSCSNIYKGELPKLLVSGKESLSKAEIKSIKDSFEESKSSLIYSSHPLTLSSYNFLRCQECGAVIDIKGDKIVSSLLDKDKEDKYFDTI